MVGVDDSSLQADSRSKVQLAWSEGRWPLGAVLHSSNEPGELSQWLWVMMIAPLTLSLVLYYYCIISSSSVKTVWDRHTVAAYHNKCCWRPFQRYQLPRLLNFQWPWTPKKGIFGEFLVFSHCDTYMNMNSAKSIWDRPFKAAYEILSINRRFKQCNFQPLRLYGSPVRWRETEAPPEKSIFRGVPDIRLRFRLAGHLAILSLSEMVSKCSASLRILCSSSPLYWIAQSKTN